MKAPVPPNEPERLAALRRLDILDTPSDAAFDELVQLAARILDVPIALVSLVDEKRQWFKSRVGLEAAETSRDLAFCAHAILKPDELLVVEDAHADPRFADNPLVTGAPGIGFYAGAPLKTQDDLAFGTLCVIDRKPRILTADQLESLRLLARQVERLLQLHERQAQLQYQAGRLGLLEHTAPLLVGELDRERRYVFANHKYRKWFGFDPAALIGKTPVQIFGEEYLAGTFAAMDACYEGERVSFERQINEDLYLAISFVPITQQGDVTGVFILANDITQLKKQQRELERERASLESVIAGTDAGTWRWNIQTSEVLVNQRWADMLGYRLDELKTPSIETWEKLLHPDEREPLRQLLARYFAGEVPSYEAKFRMHHKRGHWIWVQSRGRITERLPNGEPEWMSGTHMDITQAEEAHAAVKRSERKLATLYNLSPVAMALNRMENGDFIECNPEFCRLTGYDEAELESMNYWQLTPEKYRAAEAEQLEALRASGRYGPYEKQYVHRDGHLIPVLLNGVLIESDTGDKQIWSIVQDITERKRVEQLKNEFVSAVSHELRTPLTSITGALGLALHGLLGEIPEKVRDILGIAQRNSRRLANLINDLLDMEKLVAGKMNFDLQTQPLLPIVEQSLEANRTYASQFEVSFTLSNELGAALVRVDADRLQQVLANFLSNAVKFSPKGVTVDVRIEQLDKCARVSVIDHGPGISPEFRARLFEKFSQEDASSSRQRGGTGLGLAISKELIERMGGRIGFESELGQGACFYVTLPLKFLGDE